jgi:hypothetical protein
LVRDLGLLAGSRTKGKWRQYATPGKRSHPEGIVAKRRSGAAA